MLPIFQVIKYEEYQGLVRRFSIFRLNSRFLLCCFLTYKKSPSIFVCYGDKQTHAEGRSFGSGRLVGSIHVEPVCCHIEHYLAIFQFD